MGGDLDFVLDLRRRSASGGVLGPRIVASGPILDDRPPEWPFRLTIKTGEDARKAVQLLKQRGVDLIKVHDRTPPEAYQAIADEARRQGLPFAGHLPRGITIEAAAAAGQRSLEHLGGLRMFNQCSGGASYVAEKCRPFFEWLAKTGMWQTPTLVNWRTMFTLDTPQGDAERDHLAYASPGLLEFLALNRKMSNVGPEAVRDLVMAADAAAMVVADMQKAGVGILAGCDAMIAGFCLHDELTLMVKGECRRRRAADSDDQSRAIPVPREGPWRGRWKTRRSRSARCQPARGHCQRATDSRRDHQWASVRSRAVGCHACRSEEAVPDADTMNVVLFAPRAWWAPACCSSVLPIRA